MSMHWTPEDIDVTLNRIARDTRKDEETVAQLQEIGIGFDKGHEAYVRDYSHRWKFTPVKVKPFKPGMKRSTVMATLVISALIWTPVLIYLWRTR